MEVEIVINFVFIAANQRAGLNYDIWAPKFGEALVSPTEQYDGWKDGAQQRSSHTSPFKCGREEA